MQEVETSFLEKYHDVVKNHPNAKLAILRNGQKGYDVADMSKTYEGWDDTYISCHEPESMLMVSGLELNGKVPVKEKLILTVYLN